MINLRYSKGVINARLLLYNPNTAGVWLTVKVKAYNGPLPDSKTITGLNYVGYWNFPNIFNTIQTTVNTNTITNPSALGSPGFSPDRGPWR
jgi:hypothetical protein